MINRALHISTVPSNVNGRPDDRDRLVAHRTLLKKKLLSYFVLGLASNALNTLSYTLASFVFQDLYNELSFISGCCLTLYVTLNLHLLDVLRDGVLKKPVVTELSSVHQFPADHVYEINYEDSG